MKYKGSHAKSWEGFQEGHASTENLLWERA